MTDHIPGLAGGPNRPPKDSSTSASTSHQSEDDRPDPERVNRVLLTLGGIGAFLWLPVFSMASAFASDAGWNDKIAFATGVMTVGPLIIFTTFAIAASTTQSSGKKGSVIYALIAWLCVPIGVGIGAGIGAALGAWIR